MALLGEIGSEVQRIGEQIDHLLNSGVMNTEEQQFVEHLFDQWSRNRSLTVNQLTRLNETYIRYF
ncbi:MAG: hypothetical protein KGN01_07325 [Patescibacteria group bacterium]|nr:hypothetical protein [Patescibacteria group bacterium]